MHKETQQLRRGLISAVESWIVEWDLEMPYKAEYKNEIFSDENQSPRKVT